MATNRWSKQKKASAFLAIMLIYTILCCFFHLPLPTKFGAFYLHK